MKITENESVVTIGSSEQPFSQSQANNKIKNIYKNTVERACELILSAIEGETLLISFHQHSIEGTTPPKLTPREQELLLSAVEAEEKKIGEELLTSFHQHTIDGTTPPILTPREQELLLSAIERAEKAL